MTTQQRLDCLLKQFDELAESQGTVHRCDHRTLPLLIEKCGSANRSEIGFYIRSLDERGFVRTNCAADNTILEALITIDGYCHLNTIK